MPYKDPDYLKKYYLRNREKFCEQARLYRISHLSKKRKSEKARRTRLQEYVNSVKSKCERCPENDPCCLDFHHLNPDTKVKSVANIVRNRGSFTAIKQEIDKCIVLCANCHRKETRKQLDNNNLIFVGGSQTVSSVQASVVSSL